MLQGIISKLQDIDATISAPGFKAGVITGAAALGAVELFAVLVLAVVR